MKDRDLSALRVIELGGGIAASMAGKMLADLGARVVKLEPPAGDPERHEGPFPGGKPDPETGGAFVYLNAGKRSLTLDLETPSGREAMAGLAGRAQLVINALAPGERERFGADYEALAARNPALVMLSITPFGLSGPYRDYAANDLVLTHAGGWGWLCPGKSAPPELPPIKPFGRHALVQAGLHGAVAALGALAGAAESGLGEHIDLSVQQTVAFIIGRHLPACTYSGRVESRLSPPPYEPMSFYPCRDGWIFLICPEQDQFERLLELMGRPDWASDPRLSGREGRETHWAEVKARIGEWTAGWEVEPLFHACQQVRVGAAPVYDYPGLERSEHLLAREFFVEQPHRALGALKVPGAPYRLRWPMWAVRGPAPALGEANGEMETLFNGSAGAALPPRQVPPPPGQGAASPPGQVPPPLAGMRVLDLSWVWAGPQCTWMLAMLGAEVIKVETSKRLDLTRRTHTFATGMQPGPNRNGFFNQINQGKSSIAVNLSHPEGVALVKELAASCDVMVSNFGTGVLERLGLGADEMQRVNPALIVVTISACGQTGPARAYLGYGPLISPLAGLSAQTGYAGGEPRDVGVAYGDPNAGVYAAVAILADLLARRLSGAATENTPAPGQVIDIAMWEAMLCTGFEGWMNHVLGNPPHRPMGNRHPFLAPHNVYRCGGEDHWLALAAETEPQWRGLCAVLGRPELAGDPRFQTPAARKANEDELDRIISAWCASRERWEATALLQAAGVPAMPSLSAGDLVENPHLLAREAFTRWDHPEAGARMLMGAPWKMTRHAEGVQGPAPCLGADTDAVLERLLGKDAKTRSGLRQRGAIE